MALSATAIHNVGQTQISGADSAAREQLKIVIVGHVDHGKSTLVGRLFYETGSLPEGRYESLKAISEKRGMPFEWAFLMDSFQAERDQGITIDTSQIWFKTDHRNYVLIDAPGHTEFLKNMVTGAAQAQAAVLVIDAAEGVQDQSRRHGLLLSLIGVEQIIVAINKMDLVEYDESRFRAVETEYRAFLKTLGVTPQHIIPLSGREGDNLVASSDAMSWYKGPSLVAALDGFQVPKQDSSLSLRFPVQDVYKFDHRRIIAGRIEQGQVSVGDRLLFQPSGKSAVVRTLETWSAPEKTSASAGQSVGLTLDEQLFVERGDIATLISAPAAEADRFKARVFWIGKRPLSVGFAYKLKLATQESIVTVEHIDRVIDSRDLVQRTGADVHRNEIADVTFKARKRIVLDSRDTSPTLSRFVLVDGYELAGGGTLSSESFVDARPVSTNVVSVKTKIDRLAREQRNSHKGGVIWMTGLSGAGKSTLALELEHELFNRGWHTALLDGDNLRQGLNKDLGFSAAERSENIRRTAEVAKLMASTGTLVIVSLISPTQADRQTAREIIGDGFTEIYIKASLEACEQRDPKGLYARARSGAITEFTGISAPYEIPLTPDVVIETDHTNIEQSVDSLRATVLQQYKIS